MNITRALILLAVSVMPGCATIHIPKTLEAQECKRECMVITNQCIAAGGNWGCIGQKRDCLRSCPGAWESQATSPARSYAEAR